MGLLTSWRLRLRALFSRRHDQALREELEFHIEQLAQDHRAAGLEPAAARAAAHRQFGNLARLQEESHDLFAFRLFDDLRSDLRFGVRGLARNPGFTVTAALILSIGIGGTTAMFSVANAYLFRPFPAPDPEQLVVVAQVHDDGDVDPLSYPEYLDYRDQNNVFEGLAAYTTGGAQGFLSAADVSGPVWMEYVSRDFFEVLRVDAALGRTFLADEGRQPGDAPVVVLSHRAWQNRFGADPSVVGQVIELGPNAYTVIGVTPESFTFTDILPNPDLYVPVTQIGRVGSDQRDPLTDRNLQAFLLIGRLKPGVTVAEARANLSVLTTALATEYPDSMELSDEIWVADERRSRPMPQVASYMVPLLTMVMALAFLVLLIACANVGTLLIGRGLGRQREMALRAGLGATRLRLVRQLISESVLLAVLGGTGGTLAALWATNLLSTFGYGGVTADVTMDWQVFAFTAVATMVTGLVAGLTPALQATRIDLIRAIGKGSRRASGGATGQRLTSGLVVAQVAMSLVLLVCAGLFIRNARNAATLDLGFRTDELLLVSVDPLAQGYALDQARGFYRDVAAAVTALPGVRSASWARVAPQDFLEGEMTVATLDGGTIPETDPVSVYANHVDPAFFDTVDVRVIRGRGFRDEDATDGRPVAVISETAARQFWPNQDPLGKRFFNPNAPERRFEVIGIVGDARLQLNIFEIPAVVLLPFRGQSRPATLHVYTRVRRPPSPRQSRVSCDGATRRWRSTAKPAWTGMSSTVWDSQAPCSLPD